MAVIECVPNVSEGRRTEVIQRLADSLKDVPGLSVLDVQSDAAHNRSVFTLAGDTDAMAAGIPRLIEGAMAAIALRSHRGEHPRMGAVDVVPKPPSLIEGGTEALTRALLAGDAIIAPNEKRRAVYDRRTGAEAPTLSGGWGSGEAGSLCLWDGALFSLSAQGLLSGYFDWQGQLERAVDAAKRWLELAPASEVARR